MSWIQFITLGITDPRIYSRFSHDKIKLITMLTDTEYTVSCSYRISCQRCMQTYYTIKFLLVCIVITYSRSELEIGM